MDKAAQFFRAGKSWNAEKSNRIEYTDGADYHDPEEPS
jgi:hypothetical protein